MRPSRVRFTGRRLKIAVAAAWVTLTLSVTAAPDRHFFADTTPMFRLNAASVLVVPSALLAGLVAVLIWFVTAARRTDGPRFKVREAMMAIAFIGLGLGTARWWARYHFETVYAPGYSEGRFRQVRVGMSPIEVGSILGLPIRKVSTSHGGSSDEQWIYSDPPPPGTLGDNCWRRWVFFENNEVVGIVDDYYED